MKSRINKRFRELFATLPAHIKNQVRDAYRQFKDDPNHPGLRFKKVLSDPPTYSARVGISYRALGVLHKDTVTWFWVGSHADYDLLLKKM
jgi:hypothetical protein